MNGVFYLVNLYLLFHLLCNCRHVFSQEAPFLNVVMQCCDGDAHAAIYPDKVTFKCKPGPASGEEVCCEDIYRPDVSKGPWSCPDYGYISGWNTTVPSSVVTCCTAPGLFYKPHDCCLVVNNANSIGKIYHTEHNKVIVGTWSLTGGKTWMNIQCRYSTVYDIYIKK